MNPFEQLAAENNIQMSGQKSETLNANPDVNPFLQLSLEQPQEGFWKSSARTALQIPQGIAEGTRAGLVASAWQLLAQGEVLDPEEIDRIKAISEREGVPFDEEAYYDAAQQALGTVPTVHNIGSAIEKKTGIPLEPKTAPQKFLRLAGMAGKAIPQAGTAGAPAGTTFRGMNTNLPRPILGAGVAGTSQALQAAGVPEPFADIASFGALKGVTPGGGSLTIGRETKPSGMPRYRAEKLTEPKAVSPKTISRLNEKIEADFKKISDDIIQKGPAKETFDALKEGPEFKQKAQEAFGEVQNLAESLPGKIDRAELKTDLQNAITAKKNKGISPDEFDRNHGRFVKEKIEEIGDGNFSVAQMVDQYRKNNKNLTQYFEPGQSYAYNGAKREALLDYNRALASMIERKFPNTEFANLFKETNAQWVKISDAEFINKFIGDLFDGKVKFEKGRQFFDKAGMTRSFERSLGKEGFAQFETLMKDLVSAERGMSMLRRAEKMGLGDIAKHAMSYAIHPTFGKLTSLYKVGEQGFKQLSEFMLRRPSIIMKYDRGVNAFKAGDFKAADKEFKAIEADKIEWDRKGAKRKEAMDKFKKNRPARSETVEAKVTPIKTENVPSPSTQPKEKIQPRTPLQLEYKPLPNQPKMKNRNSQVSQKLFDESVKGGKLAPSQKDVLRKSQVSLMTTRGKGQQFHGTKSSIDELHPNIYDTSSEMNIYGPGFYTTDALDIAQGYSKPKKSKDATVYKITEKTPQKIFDAEKDLSKFKKLYIDYQEKYLKFLQEKRPNEKDIAYVNGKLNNKKNKDLTFEEYVSDNEILELIKYKKPKNLRELYDNIRENSIYDEDPAYAVQEKFSDLISVLEDAGYDGISHKGGLLTNNPEHLVKIYWKPENLEIEPFYYPKSFKKVSKINPPKAK